MSTPTPTFAIAGRSLLEDSGLHHFGQYGGFQPWHGGFGRLSESRCRALIRVFDTEDKAQAAAAQLRQQPNICWAVWVVPNPNTTA